MYSPKIPERLIPTLYRTARSRGLPMTHLVAEILDAYLATQDQETEGQSRNSLGSERTGIHSDSFRAPDRRLVLRGATNASDSQPT